MKLRLNHISQFKLLILSAMTPNLFLKINSFKPTIYINSFRDFLLVKIPHAIGLYLFLKICLDGKLTMPSDRPPLS